MLKNGYESAWPRDSMKLAQPKHMFGGGNMVKYASRERNLERVVLYGNVVLDEQKMIGAWVTYAA